MAARAIWKGVLRFDDHGIPVKLYSAIQDRNIHFRLLHRKDKSPVKQAMINPDSGKIVPYADTLKAYINKEGDMVILTKEELRSVQPEVSRDIHIEQFLPPAAIDHRWYDRAYYLGPDEAEGDYFALCQALQQSEKEGLAQWVMRNKSYTGALTYYDGYLLLISLYPAEQVVNAEELPAPTGKPLDDKELRLAAQLIATLEDDFKPASYHDEYRERVMELIDAKRKGKPAKHTAVVKPQPAGDLMEALEKSLQVKKHG